MNKALKKLLTEEGNKTHSKLVSSSEQAYGFIPTYFPFIDMAVSPLGLFPKGAISEIMGLKSSCKTTLVLHALAEQLRRNVDNPPNILWADFENQLLDMKPYAEALGVNISADNFIHIRPAFLETGCQFILDAVKTGSVDFVVIDSNAAMRPKEEHEKGIGNQHQKGLRSLRISEFIRNLNAEMTDIANKGKTPPTIIIINQVYIKLNIGGPPVFGGPQYDSPGSGAIKFYAACRIELKVRGAEYRMVTNPYTFDRDKIKVCSVIELFIEKCKVAIPHRKVKFIVRYGEGVDPVLSFIKAAANLKIVKKVGKEDKGSRYLYFDSKGVESKSYLGLLGLYDFLRDNPEVIYDLCKHPKLTIWEQCLRDKLPMVDYARSKMADQLKLVESANEGGFINESGKPVEDIDL